MRKLKQLVVYGGTFGWAVQFMVEDICPELLKGFLHGNVDLVQILCDVVEGNICGFITVFIFALVVYIVKTLRKREKRTISNDKPQANLTQKSAVPVVVTKTRKASRTDSSRCLFFMSKFDHFV